MTYDPLNPDFSTPEGRLMAAIFLPPGVCTWCDMRERKPATHKVTFEIKPTSPIWDGTPESDHEVCETHLFEAQWDQDPEMPLIKVEALA